MARTKRQYFQIAEKCKDVFVKKTVDYGTAWRVLRPISVVDQIFIKAQRIRNIQETGVQKVEDDIPSEFLGIINYAIIGLMQLELTEDDPEELEAEQAGESYKKHFDQAFALMENKNHDYGEAWRSMSQEGLTDLILMKLQRMRSIIANKGRTLISEGLDANYYDMINYAVFALILIDEKT